MKTTKSRKRATKNYFNKKIKEGWVRMNVFIPPKIKEILMTEKHKLMKEYYGEKINK